MGTEVRYRITDAVIEKQSYPSALEAVNALFKNRRSYSWLDVGERNHTSLKTAIEEWGFVVDESPDSLEISQYEWEKTGEEEYLLSALAPFLNPDAKFEVLFTDYFHFRCYVVRSGQLFELAGRVVYEDQGKPVNQ